MIKSVSFIVLTHFFHFNQLKINLFLVKLNQQYFFYSDNLDNKECSGIIRNKE